MAAEKKTEPTSLSMTMAETKTDPETVSAALFIRKHRKRPNKIPKPQLLKSKQDSDFNSD